MGDTDRDTKLMSLSFLGYGTILTVMTVLFLLFQSWFVYGFYLFPFLQLTLPNSMKSFLLAFDSPFVFAYAAFILIAAPGLYKRWKWSRIAFMTLGGLLILNLILSWNYLVPVVFGILGVIVLWYMTGEDVKEYLS
jgi:hypothetical protein